MSVTIDDVKNDLAEFAKESLKGVLMFDSNDNVLLAQDLKSNTDCKYCVHHTRVRLRQLFEDEQEAFCSGIFVNEVLYEVHRFYTNTTEIKSTPHLVYGRRPVQSNELDLKCDGCAVARAKTNSLGDLFIVIIYEMPTVSARVIPRLVEICNNRVSLL